MGRGRKLTPREIVGGALRDLREEAGLRQADLGDKLGRPQSFISKYENGEQGLDILDLRQILEVLGSRLDEFVQTLEPMLEGPKPPRRRRRTRVR